MLSDFPQTTPELKTLVLSSARMSCDCLVGHPTGRDEGSTGEPSIWLPSKLEVLEITALRPHEKRIEENFR
jgi:hypothetical protein